MRHLWRKHFAFSPLFFGSFAGLHIGKSDAEWNTNEAREAPPFNTFTTYTVYNFVVRCELERWKKKLNIKFKKTHSRICIPFTVRFERSREKNQNKMRRPTVRLNQFLQRMMQRKATEKGSHSHRKEYFTAYLHRMNGRREKKMNNPVLHAWSACMNQNLNLNKYYMVCVFASAKIGEHRSKLLHSVRGIFHST